MTASSTPCFTHRRIVESSTRSVWATSETVSRSAILQRPRWTSAHRSHLAPSARWHPGPHDTDRTCPNRTGFRGCGRPARPSLARPHSCFLAVAVVGCFLTWYTSFVVNKVILRIATGQVSAVTLACFFVAHPLPRCLLNQTSYTIRYALRFSVIGSVVFPCDRLCSTTSKFRLILVRSSGVRLSSGTTV